MKNIALSNGMETVVDDEDYDFLSQFKWQARLSNGNWYARRSVYRPGKSPLSIHMHREIMHAPNKSMLDHVDGNGLNNQKGNLRFCTVSQNNSNKKCVNKHGYIGVNFDRRCKSKPWQAFARVNGRNKSFGYYETAKEAAIAYDLNIIKYRDGFERLNFRALEKP